MAQTALPAVAAPEKPDLEIAFVPILCATPLLLAHRAGLFEKHGLRVYLRQAPGWGGVKQLLVYGIVDAAHMLTSMPLACSLGIDGKQADLRLALVQNVNGQALTLAVKHRGIGQIADMKGFALAVPYRFSMHYYLLCHLLAEHGLDPLHDVAIREVAPPRMPYYLEKGWVDGIFAPEPFGQIAVDRGLGFVDFLSRDRWPGHPCCSLATTQRFIDHYPNTYRAMLLSVLEAEQILHRADPDQRRAIARQISGPGYLNLPGVLAVEEALAGESPDGYGGRPMVPDRIDFIPYPRPEVGVWIVTQMQRWGQLPGKIDYEQVVGAGFRHDAWELAEATGWPPAPPAWTEGSPWMVRGDPFLEMLRQPFCAFRERPPAVQPYDLSAAARARLSGLVGRLARMAAGDLDSPVEVTAEDEIGLLEQAMNETVLAARFAREALAEHSEALEERVRERTVRLEREIAERKRVEESLRLNESRLEALLHLNRMTGAALREITDFALEEAVKLTRSRIGYLAFLNEGQPTTMLA